MEGGIPCRFFFSRVRKKRHGVTPSRRPALNARFLMPIAPNKFTMATIEARLARRFDLLTEPTPVGPLRVQSPRVAAPQVVLDQIGANIARHERETGQRVKGDSLGLPYWAELWDSA